MVYPWPAEVSRGEEFRPPFYIGLLQFRVDILHALHAVAECLAVAGLVGLHAVQKLFEYKGGKSSSVGLRCFRLV